VNTARKTKPQSFSSTAGSWFISQPRRAARGSDRVPGKLFLEIKNRLAR
jgi:hypothetical protein